MGKRIIFSLLSLVLLATQPVPAQSDWDKLFAEANQAMQADTSTPAADTTAKANATSATATAPNTPSWDDMTKRSQASMSSYTRSGQGVDVMGGKTNRAIDKMAADDTSTLTGRFYDLKQPVREGAKPLHREAVVEFIKNFMDADWDRSMLRQYYSPKVKLEAPYFYLPRCKAAYAPYAFNCNSGSQTRKVEPLDWVVHYSGTVIAPESGNFRFVGMGDDAIVVRFDNKVVLEAGWSIPSRNNMTLGISRKYQDEITSPSGGRALYQYKEIPHWNQMLGGLPSGRHFHVTKGKAYPIEILLSEIPGNEFGYCLLIEKVHGNGDHGKFGPDESPTLALFRTNDLLPDLEEIKQALKRNGTNYAVGKNLEVPPFLLDSPVWTVTEDSKQKRTFADYMTASEDDDTAMGRRAMSNDPDDISDSTDKTRPARKKARKARKKSKKNAK